MKRYLEYKNSGVEWIGKIPRHWEVKRLKYVAKILPSNVDKHIYPDEVQVRLCNYTDVYYNDYITLIFIKILQISMFISVFLVFVHENAC